MVEDEYLVSLGITSLLEDLEFTVVGPAARVDVACQLAANTDLALAVLDINIAGELSWPVARILQARRVPLLFLSGYLSSSVSIPLELAQAPICVKPLDPDQVSAVIEQLLRDRATDHLG